MREREREKNIDWLPPIHTPTGDWTHRLGMCPDWKLNPQPFNVWGNAPANWATGQGQTEYVWKEILWFGCGVKDIASGQITYLA